MSSVQAVHMKLPAHILSKQVPVCDIGGEAKLYPSLNINIGMGLEHSVAGFCLRKICECLMRKYMVKVLHYVEYLWAGQRWCEISLQIPASLWVVMWTLSTKFMKIW